MTSSLNVLNSGCRLTAFIFSSANLDASHETHKKDETNHTRRDGQVRRRRHTQGEMSFRNVDEELRNKNRETARKTKTEFCDEKKRCSSRLWLRASLAGHLHDRPSGVVEPMIGRDKTGTPEWWGEARYGKARKADESDACTHTRPVSVNVWTPHGKGGTCFVSTYVPPVG